MGSKSCPLEANYADLVMTSLLQVVLLGAAPLLEIDEVGCNMQLADQHV